MHADTMSQSRAELVCDPNALLLARISREKKTDSRFRISLVGEFEDPAMASSSCLFVRKIP